MQGHLTLDSHPKKSVTINDRLVNSLVCDHLRAERMSSTLSVFLPESGYVARHAVPLVHVLSRLID
jgi:hypothetical protein